MTKQEQLKQLYQEIYELTNIACVNCPNEAAKLPYRCCDPIACENARKWASLKGVVLQETDHPTLPFMGPDGCTIDITLRPLCTMHSCNPNCERDERYQQLRKQIEHLEGEEWEKYLCQLMY